MRLITVCEAAIMLNVGKERVLELVRQGKLRSKIEGFRRLVDADSVEQLLRESANVRTVKAEGTNGEDLKAKVMRCVQEKGSDYLTVKEIAQLLGCSRSAVKSRIYAGRLRAMRGADGWELWIYYKDLLDLLPNFFLRRRRGRSKTKLREGYVTLVEAREYLRIQRGKLIQLLKEGVIAAYRVGRIWGVDAESLKEYNAQRNAQKNNRAGSIRA